MLGSKALAVSKSRLHLTKVLTEMTDVRLAHTSWLPNTKSTRSLSQSYAETIPLLHCHSWDYPPEAFSGLQVEQKKLGTVQTKRRKVDSLGSILKFSKKKQTGQLSWNGICQLGKHRLPRSTILILADYKWWQASCDEPQSQSICCWRCKARKFEILDTSFIIFLLGSNQEELQDGAHH
jgi:hypothetical protein